jgi:hypothetical protein
MTNPTIDQESRLNRAEARIDQRLSVLAAIWRAADRAAADRPTMRSLEKWLAAQAAPLHQEREDLAVLRARTRPVRTTNRPPTNPVPNGWAERTTG